jgi:hypothetical protein
MKCLTKGCSNESGNAAYCERCYEELYADSSDDHPENFWVAGGLFAMLIVLIALAFWVASC